MSQSQECLIAEFADRESLATAVEVLHKAEFNENDFSVVTSAEGVSQTSLDEAEDTHPASPPAEKTMGASTLAGGTLGAVLGTATLVGPLLVAGPLAGMAAGAVGGGILSSVKSWGVKEDVGKNYEQKVAQGSSLIVVDGEDAKLSKAERMLITCAPVSVDRYKAR